MIDPGRLGQEEDGEMIEIRKSADRGRTRTSWLDSRHTFSFGYYHDPAQMGFGPLRVINEDWIAPGYAELDFALEPGVLRALATPEGREETLAIEQDASVYALRTRAEQPFTYAIAPGRQVWIQVAEGEGLVAGHRVEAGDGVALREEAAVEVTGTTELEVLIFDLP